MIFVYPYRKQYDQGNELLASINSLVMNFSGNVNTLIIGEEKPTWYSGDFLRCRDNHANKEANLGHKMALLCNQLDKDDNFIWINDDILLLRPAGEEFFDKTYSWGSLAEKRLPQRLLKYNSWPWGRRLWFTISWLHENKCPLINCETHLPYKFNVGKMLEVFDVFPVKHGATLLATSYFNYHNKITNHKSNAKEAGLFIYNKMFAEELIKEHHIWFNYNAPSYKCVSGFIKKTFL
jgi:hypothetical protein